MFSLAGLSMPAFWLGMVIILGLVNVKLHAMQFLLAALVLALVMSAALGPALHHVVIAISIARVLGVQHLRIAFRHILPDTMGPFIVLCPRLRGT